MGIGDYICVTLRGGAPWGFTLKEGEGVTYRPFIVSQVEEGGPAFLAGVRDGDEVVSVNGEPCADLTLLRVFALIDTSINTLQLLVKRYNSTSPEDSESEGTCCAERASSGEAEESTVLHILSPKHRSQIQRELYISESQDEADHGEVDSNTEFTESRQLLFTQSYASTCEDQRGREFVLKKNDDEVQRCFSPGDMVEVQVALSEQTLDDFGCTSLGSAIGIEGGLSHREAVESIHTTTLSHYVPSSAREPLGQRGVVVSSPSMLGQVEVILQQQATSRTGRGILSVGGPRVTESLGSQSEGEEGGGHDEGAPGSFTVSFEVPSEEATQAEEQDSESEGDQDKPNKHRAKHARLRRSESLSEKQVKEAKSKCKRIALLLTAAPPNPNNKGVLMFKKHRQRAKKYTLVSYGTGEDEPEYSDEEDEENGETVEFTLVADDNSELGKHLLTNVHSSKGVLTLSLDKSLLEIERNLNNQAEMECLPETKGKGAVMFAQRRQRMDEISAEHEELRRQGIPVDGVPEVGKKIMEHSYMQSTTEGHGYMDVNVHQQSQQQYQQYQEQQFYQQQQTYQHQQQYQQQYQQQQQQQQQQQHQQQQQYEHYQQQQMYQQQGYIQEQQQQMQQYSSNVNGTVQHQTSEFQSSFSNRTAKPFTAENMVATPYSHAMSGTNQDSAGQGEQIASRDERISTPAIKTGFLLDARKRNTGKPMFTFKEAPKVSPNPALLNLLNKSDKKGFETGPEEDYLSLGAEACNFLQSQRVKHKTPPPVAPKPVINPNSPPWSPPIETTNQDMPQPAENSLSTPAVAPTTENTPAPELEPTPAPAPEPSPLPAPQETPANTATAEQHAWTVPEPEPQQQPLQMTAQEENGHINCAVQPESAPATTWGGTQPQQQVSSASWHPAQVQPQEPPPSQSPPQPPWVTRNQAQPQPPTNTWTPQIQPSWTQEPQEQADRHAQPPWAQSCEQPQSQSQVQPTWTQSHEQSHQQHPTWGQAQEPMQSQPQNPWTQPLQSDPQHQPPWVQQAQKEPQRQPPWAQQVQPESQLQPPWVQQPQHQTMQPTWQQGPTPSQPQPPWVSTQPQQQQQPTSNPWPSSQTQAQAQPPWVQAAQPQPQQQPQANLNPWAPAPTQPQAQPSWVQNPAEHSQPPMNSWTQDQNQAQNQPPWAQPGPPQPTPQSNWQQSTLRTPSQPQMNTWPAQTQPQPPVNAWTPQSQQTPVNVCSSAVNTRPSPKPWQPPQSAQNRTPPSPPQRMHSFNIGQRASPPINPMATVLNPSSAGSSFEMPAVRGKGADMFAKRQSRMEKFVVDSETVEANKASRSTSPSPSLPNEWKYTPNTFGRSYSLSPPARVLSTGQKSASASSSPRPPARASTTTPSRQTSWLDKGRKSLTPWEAASRHPLGLVDEAFASQNLQQSLASNVRLAAQRKILPEPPADWKAKVSYQAPQKTGSQTWSQSQSRSPSRAPLPSFVASTRSPASTPFSQAGYRSLPRQWQPHKSATEANLRPSVSSSEYNRPFGNQMYKSVHTSNNWSWRR